jgi:TniQ
MDISSAMPGEWAEGYMGRLARLNGETSRSKLKRALERHLLSRGVRVQPSHGFIPLVAEVADLTIEEVIVGHTTWPVRRIVARPSGSVFFEELFTNNTQKGLLKRGREQNWLCPKCATAFGEFSYWHRNHQIPGQMHCQTDGTPLQYVERTPTLLEQPHELLARCHEPSASLRECVTGNANIAKATSILVALVEERVISSGATCLRVLNERAVARGFTADGSGRYPELRSQIATDFPAEWIAHSIPATSRTLPDRLGFVDLIFLADPSYASGIGLSIVIAALFDDSASAIDALR